MGEEATRPVDLETWSSVTLAAFQKAVIEPCSSGSLKLPSDFQPKCISSQLTPSCSFANITFCS